MIRDQHINPPRLQNIRKAILQRVFVFSYSLVGWCSSSARQTGHVRCVLVEDGEDEGEGAGRVAGG